ncbi:helix-turn-helix domain-containing protein [Methanococcus voltae]|nr:helix-turn-helix transcriptional regulator [Methanococcus voltae]
MYSKLNIIERVILLDPKYIKVFRNKLKITQSKLAEESGVSQSHLSMLEKGKREIGEAHAAALTLGLLKSSNALSKEDPISYLLDVLSLTKLESAIVQFIYDITHEKDHKCRQEVEGYPVYIIDKKYFSEELKKRVDVIEIEKIDFFRGKMKIEGKHFDKKEVVLLDCADIRRLEKKVSNTLKNKTIIQIFPKSELPPIYSCRGDCIILHCW